MKAVTPAFDTIYGLKSFVEKGHAAPIVNTTLAINYIGALFTKNGGSQLLMSVAGHIRAKVFGTIVLY